jgi:hypothetical protein
MPTGLQKGLEEFSMKCYEENRPFIGMNPKLRSNDELEFDSNFESGNLDIVCKVSET